MEAAAGVFHVADVVLEVYRYCDLLTCMHLRALCTTARAALEPAVQHRGMKLIAPFFEDTGEL
jgi:hypothetical protein